MAADIDGSAVDFWGSCLRAGGSNIEDGRPDGRRLPCISEYSGAASTCPNTWEAAPRSAWGNSAGTAGRSLMVGDVLHLGAAGSGVARSPVATGASAASSVPVSGSAVTGEPAAAGSAIPEALRPAIAEDWELGVLYGPHGAPDFFTEEDMTVFFSDVVERALQLQPHRRAIDRRQAQLGARRRRRGRFASFEYSRYGRTPSVPSILRATCR